MDLLKFGLLISPSLFLLGLCGLSFFFQRKFFLHRVGGFLFLGNYIFSWYCYYFQPDWFIPMTVPLLGCVQTITAIRTFKFLPKEKVDPGYYGDKGAITVPFIRENLFYQLITLFGSFYFSSYFPVYVHDNAYRNQNGIFWAVEVIWGILPFVFIRPLFPRTRFRDALSNEKGRSDKNKTFYVYGIWFIKFLYLMGKHFMGYYLNYLRFLDLLSPSDLHTIQFMMLLNSGTMSIAVFLHTLRFKKMLNPRTAYALYVFLAYLPLLGFLDLAHLFLDYPHILGITLVGLVLNLYPWKYSAYYQIILTHVLTTLKFLRYQDIPFQS